MDPKQILVIDNDVFYRELLREILEKEGYSVKKASDGLQGIEMAKKESFYCIFVDLIMPRVDGIKFIKYIRGEQKLKEIPITILSGALTDELIHKDEINADFYLYKGPVEAIEKNIKTILEMLETGKRDKDGALPVFGLDDMHKRAVVKELMNEKSHHETILKNIGEAVIETNDSLKISYGNPAALKIFNKTETELVGIYLYDLFKAENLHKIRAAAEKISASPDPEVSTHTIHYEKLILKIFLANLIEKDGNAGTVLIAQDVTPYYTKVRQLTVANEQLKKMQDKLVQNAKLSMLGELTANLTGEIESPLLSALSYTTLLLNESSISDPVRDKLDIIQGEILRVKSMIGDLIDFGREEEGEREKVQVADLLKLIVALVKPRAETARIKIVENYDKNLPLVYVNANKTKQVFINLINNAFEAMPDGGRLTLTISATPDTTGRENIQVAVFDTGTGISPEVLPQIFNPFFSAKIEGDASGMGLTTSLKIIQETGGTIEVNSNAGEGSVFRVNIPVSEDDLKKTDDPKEE